MIKKQKLVELANLVGRMDHKGLVVLRAYAISVKYGQRSWLATNGAAIQRLNEWLMIGESDHVGDDFQEAVDGEG